MSASLPSSFPHAQADKHSYAQIVKEANIKAE